MFLKKMERHLSNYEIEKIAFFQQELLNNNHISQQAQKLKQQFLVLCMSYVSLVAWIFFYCLYYEYFSQLSFWSYLYLLFFLLVYHIQSYHFSYIHAKKTFSQHYKKFLIPRILQWLESQYQYKTTVEYDYQHQGIIPQKEIRNINQDIEKIIESWLWEWRNRSAQTTYWFFQLLAFLNVFGLLFLFLKNRFRKKVIFEDVFSWENEHVKLQAVEIQHYPLVFTKNTSGSKFLTKFSYSNARFRMSKDIPFFIKLFSLKTKIKNLQFTGKKVWCYFFFLITQVIPLFIFAFADRGFLWEKNDRIIFWILGVVFFLMYTIFVFDLDPRRLKKSEFNNSLVHGVRGSILFSLDFLDYYDIQTNDQVLANQFLDPAMKEKLMLLHQQYRGTYDFYFEGNDFYCIKHLSKGKHFLDTFSHWNWDKNHTLQALYLQIKELDWLFSIVDIH